MTNQEIKDKLKVIEKEKQALILQLTNIKKSIEAKNNEEKELRNKLCNN